MPAHKSSRDQSRPIRLRAEYEFPLSPLEVPAAPNDIPVHVPAAKSVGGPVPSPGAMVRPEFVLARENALDVATIGQRLEGLPLAIELAAARIRVLTPTNILARLEHRLPFLRSGMVDVRERQRTMREAIAWSHDLLDSGAQRLFQRLAVFAGGCDLSAVETVCTRFDGTDIARMEQEQDNLPAAVKWCIQHRMAEMGLRLAAGAWTFWYVRGYAEGRTYIAALLALPDARTVMAPRAIALMGAAQLGLARGDYAYGRPLIQQSVALFRKLQDQRGTSDALLCAGFLARSSRAWRKTTRPLGATSTRRLRSA